MDEKRPTVEQLGAWLQELADILGVPPSLFYDDEATPPVDDLLDLMTNFVEIGDVQARKGVMLFAKSELIKWKASQDGVTPFGP